jgi:hypothetical protein
VFLFSQLFGENNLAKILKGQCRDATTHLKDGNHYDPQQPYYPNSVCLAASKAACTHEW